MESAISLATLARCFSIHSGPLPAIVRLTLCQPIWLALSDLLLQSHQKIITSLHNRTCCSRDGRMRQRGFCTLVFPAADFKLRLSFNWAMSSVVCSRRIQSSGSRCSLTIALPRALPLPDGPWPGQTRDPWALAVSFVEKLSRYLLCVFHSFVAFTAGFLRVVQLDTSRAVFREPVVSQAPYDRVLLFLPVRHPSLTLHRDGGL